MDEMDSSLDDLSKKVDRILARLVQEEEWITRLNQDEQYNRMEQTIEAIYKYFEAQSFANNVQVIPSPTSSFLSDSYKKSTYKLSEFKVVEVTLELFDEMHERDMGSCNAETRVLPHVESMANPSSCINSFVNGSNDVGDGGTSNDVEYCETFQILSIGDQGIDMTKENLIKNLGTITTLAFVEKIQIGARTEPRGARGDFNPLTLAPASLSSSSHKKKFMVVQLNKSIISFCMDIVWRNKSVIEWLVGFD